MGHLGGLLDERAAAQQRRTQRLGVGGQRLDLLADRDRDRARQPALDRRARELLEVERVPAGLLQQRGSPRADEPLRISASWAIVIFEPPGTPGW